MKQLLSLFRYIIYTFAILSGIFIASSAFAQDPEPSYTVVTEISFQPQHLQESLGKISPGAANATWIQALPKIKHFGFFFVRDENKSLIPVALIDGLTNPKEVPPPLRSLNFSVQGNWMIGAPKGTALPISFFNNVLIPEATKTPPAAVYMKARPADIVDSLNADGKFKEQTQATMIGIILKELADVDSLEIRADAHSHSLRLIAIVKARADTPLNQFLNQRLPDKLPAEHNLIPVSRAGFYGYFIYNPDATQAYLKHWSENIGGTMPTLSMRLITLSPLLASSRGYSAFVGYENEAAPRIFHEGNWNSASGPEFVFADEAAMMPIASLDQFSLKQSFLIGETPVWRLTISPDKKDVAAGASPAALKNTLYSLTNGNLVSAVSPEAMTEFLQDLTPPTTETNTLGKNFNALPTICFQAKYKVSSLMQALLRQSGGSNTDSLYAAASMGHGEIALTFDLPYELLAPVMQLMREPATPTSVKAAATKK